MNNKPQNNETENFKEDIKEMIEQSELKSGNSAINFQEESVVKDITDKIKEFRKAFFNNKDTNLTPKK